MLAGILASSLSPALEAQEPERVEVMDLTSGRHVEYHRLAEHIFSEGSEADEKWVTFVLANPRGLSMREGVLAFHCHRDVDEAGYWRYEPEVFLGGEAFGPAAQRHTNNVAIFYDHAVPLRSFPERWERIDAEAGQFLTPLYTWSDRHGFFGTFPFEVVHRSPVKVVVEHTDGSTTDYEFDLEGLSTGLKSHPCDWAGGYNPNAPRNPPEGGQ